jgi:hypothetical protein
MRAKGGSSHSRSVPPAPVPAPAGPAATEREGRGERTASYNNPSSNSDPAHTARRCPSANVERKTHGMQPHWGPRRYRRGPRQYAAPHTCSCREKRPDNDADPENREGPADGYRVQAEEVEAGRPRGNTGTRSPMHKGEDTNTVKGGRGGRDYFDAMCSGGEGGEGVQPHQPTPSGRNTQHTTPRERAPRAAAGSIAVSCCEEQR